MACVKRFAGTWIIAFSFYLLLIAGAWSRSEITGGVIIATVVAAMTCGFYFRDELARHGLFRLPLLLVYIFLPLWLEMVKANLEVAWRVLTGKIRPGIVCYRSGLKSDSGLMMLANSITLTPGTLSVDVDEKSRDIFVHVLNIPEGREKEGVWSGKALFQWFDLSGWVRRITE
jgi:multicomponent Na+:H+ antiporter subunit E